jgi:hypothetical protein
MHLGPAVITSHPRIVAQAARVCQAQRVLGHATAAMTMDLYGHMMDANLWQAARLIGDI